MALLRNREVSLLSKTDGLDEAPNYIVMYKDGERENAKLTDLQLTDDEHKNLTRLHGEAVMTNVNKIDSKSLQEIRDSQDPKKIIEKQSKPQPQTQTQVA